MDSQTIIESFRKLAIQIATPYSTGTGFMLPEHNLIITNEHVVRDNKQVVIQGYNFEKILTDVLFLDEKFDVAFLQIPESINIDFSAQLSGREVEEGDEVIAIGHPFGLNYSATKGIVSNTLHKMHEIEYIQHDAALNPGNSGGPLISKHEEIIGINTFVVRNGHKIGFSLPSKYLRKTIAEYLEGDGKKAIRCEACEKIIFETQNSSKYCEFCGARIRSISSIEDYVAIGTCRTIEQIIAKLNYSVPLTRIGLSHWEVKRGSAYIHMSYHQKSGLITGDAHLCSLPEENIKQLYTYLLEQNYHLDGLTLSVKGNHIILSLLIYDQYLNLESGIDLFDHLFEEADRLDNILVEEFGAQWLK